MTRDQRERANERILSYGLVTIFALICFGIASCVAIMGRTP